MCVHAALSSLGLASPHSLTRVQSGRLLVAAAPATAAQVPVATAVQVCFARIPPLAFFCPRDDQQRFEGLVVHVFVRRCRWFQVGGARRSFCYADAVPFTAPSLRIAAPPPSSCYLSQQRKGRSPFCLSSSFRRTICVSWRAFIRFSRLAMLAASCLPNGVKVRILILLLQHLSIDASYAGPEHFQLGRDSFMMQVCFF